jgi:hypothetical protein
MFAESIGFARSAATRLLAVVVLLSLNGTAPIAHAAIGAELPGGAAPRSSPPSAPLTHNMYVLLYEMTLVQLVSETEEGYARTVCAGNGLVNVRPSPFGPVILIPNAGDLSAGGSNVSIKLMPDRRIFFIPRVQGQRIRVPMDVGDKLAGQEVLSLTFEEGMQLMAADQLIWTARDQGPYGDGRGLPGHIAICDPWFNPNQASDPN